MPTSSILGLNVDRYICWRQKYKYVHISSFIYEQFFFSHLHNCTLLFLLSNSNGKRKLNSTISYLTMIKHFKKSSNKLQSLFFNYNFRFSRNWMLFKIKFIKVRKANNLVKIKTIKTRTNLETIFGGIWL